MERIFKSVIMEMKSVRDRMIKKSIIALFFLLAVLGPGLEAAVFTNIRIRNISNDVTNSVIMWTNITTVSQNWIVAEQYVSVDYLTNHAVITGWGIQIYTHNRTNIANPRYKGLSNANTLVDTTYSNFLLPMAWLIKTNKSKPARPKERLDHSGFSNYDWHFMTDRSTGGFTNEKDYYIPWNQGGIAWHEVCRQQKPRKVYLYFAAKFENLFVTRYQTSQLRVEEYANSDALFLKRFFIYTNAWTGSEPNHYVPATMGGINIFEDNYTTSPHSGPTCIRFQCDYLGTGWGGVYYLEPEQNWTGGRKKGYDLTGATKLTFWIRANAAGPLAEYGYGLAGDSCGKNTYYTFACTTSWQQVTISLAGKDLRDVVGGFYFVSNTDRIFYIDDIRYEK